VNQYTEACKQNLDDARREAYDAHKGQYFAGVIGSSSTLLTGGGAGALGASSHETLSGVIGVVSVLSGLGTIWLVNKQAVQQGEDRQTTLLNTWSKMTAARKAYEAAVIAQDIDLQKTTLAQFAAALQDCGLVPPPAGFF
jgi:hypothetical protein